MKRILVALAVIALANVAVADLLVAYDFTGYSGDELRGTSTTVNVNMQDPAYIERGAGVNASGNASRFNANNWTETSLNDAVTANDYFTWTLNADSGYTFSVTNLAFTFQRSSTGGQDWALRSSLDGFTANLQTWTALGNSSQTVDLQGSNLVNQTSIEFRFYGYNGSSTAGTAGFEGSGDDLVINGSVQAIPEPGTMAMFGAGILALFLVRRRFS